VGRCDVRLLGRCCLGVRGGDIKAVARLQLVRPCETFEPDHLIVKTVSVSSVLAGLFVGFILPYLFIFSTSWIVGTFSGFDSAIYSVWFGVSTLAVMFGGPVLAGYVAATLAKIQPLLHGLLVGVLLGGARVAVAQSSRAVVFAIILCATGGLVGGWLFRRFFKREPTATQ
jgi:hypothetical protein